MRLPSSELEADLILPAERRDSLLGVVAMADSLDRRYVEGV